MEKAFDIIRKINKAGFAAYLVGGSVRDHILKRKTNDYDISTSALPDEVKQIFPEAADTGISHGTVTLSYDNEKFEITTFRSESGYSDNRHPDNIMFIDDVTADLSRRDFTMNAIAMDPEGNFIDPFNGMLHISEKMIYAVNDPEKSFAEDSLRMLRAIRFSCQLGFEIDHSVLNAIKSNRKKIKTISLERITDEISKTVNAKHVENLIYLYNTELIYEINKYSRKFDPLILKRIPPRYKYRLYAFISLSSIGSNSLSLSNTDTDEYNSYMMPIENNRVFIKKLLQKYNPELITKILFFRSYLEDSDYYLLALEQLQDIIKYKEPYDIKQLAINGNDLMKAGITNGIDIGSTLDYLLDIVMLHPEKNKSGILLSLGQSFLKK